MAVVLPGKSHKQETGGLQSMGSQRVRHDLAHMHAHRYMNLLKKFDLFLVKKIAFNNC